MVRMRFSWVVVCEDYREPTAWIKRHLVKGCATSQENQCGAEPTKIKPLNSPRLQEGLLKHPFLPLPSPQFSCQGLRLIPAPRG